MVRFNQPPSPIKKAQFQPLIKTKVNLQYVQEVYKMGHYFLDTQYNRTGIWPINIAGYPVKN